MTNFSKSFDTAARQRTNAVDHTQVGTPNVWTCVEAHRYVRYRGAEMKPMLEADVMNVSGCLASMCNRRLYRSNLGGVHDEERPL